MEIVITDNSFYLLQVNIGQNYYLIQARGFWHSSHLLKNLMGHLEEAIALLKVPFDIINDFSQIDVVPVEVTNEIVIPCMLRVKESGLRRTATIMPVDFIAQLGAELMYNQVKNPNAEMCYFSTVEEAKQWIASMKKLTPKTENEEDSTSYFIDKE